MDRQIFARCDKAASQAGFDAVECHWPYEHDPLIITKTLSQTGLPMLGLNTQRGDLSKGENGLSGAARP